MKNTLPTYAPPNLNRRELVAGLLEWYPSHTGSRQLLTDLVEEYVRFWRMFLSYPHRRVVATGPIMAVQRVHWNHGSKQYFNDCMDYFNRFLAPRDIAWRGTIDHQGTHDTVTVYHDLYSAEPPVAWVDMTSLYGIKKNSLKVV